MLSRPDIQKGAEAINRDGLVCYPTEGVFGLGCLPTADKAVARILEFKHRQVEQGLILIAATLEHLEPWIAPSAVELDRLRSATSIPTTWVITSSSATPDWVTGGRNTVAVRVCSHPVAQQLCLLSASALISTSTNRSGRPAAFNAINARYRTRNSVDAFVSGTCNPALGASEIRIATSGKLLRGASS
ncbi:MAG: Sua5/YciO/YrdC/YwlC family protein [Gammaproteobacteria bacterium]|nr:Sua5/YciO/YrdC/YwlC family protein [Gammaproteobacteria bacterium]